MSNSIVVRKRTAMLSTLLLSTVVLSESLSCNSIKELYQSPTTNSNGQQTCCTDNEGFIDTTSCVADQSDFRRAALQSIDNMWVYLQFFPNAYFFFMDANNPDTIRARYFKSLKISSPPQPTGDSVSLEWKQWWFNASNADHAHDFVFTFTRMGARGIELSSNMAPDLTGKRVATQKRRLVVNPHTRRTFHPDCDFYFQFTKSMWINNSEIGRAVYQSALEENALSETSYDGTEIPYMQWLEEVNPSTGRLRYEEGVPYHFCIIYKRTNRLGVGWPMYRQEQPLHGPTKEDIWRVYEDTSNVWNLS